MSFNIIGIAGATCSGKTTASKQILAQFGNAGIIVSQDNYYFGGSSITNYDVPQALDLELLCSHIIALKQGLPIEMPNYDFTTHQRLPNTTLIWPTSNIIVEGILIFTHPGIVANLDLKIFVKSNKNICQQRRIKRDMMERGRDLEDIINQYNRDVIPSNKQYVNPSKNCADIILNNNVDGHFIGLQVLLRSFSK